MDGLVMWMALFLQVQFQVQVSVPQIRFEVAPPVVEVQPGLFVVHDYEEEVFVVDGQYWTRGGDGRWYRSRDYRGGWAAAPAPAVPPALVRTPRGRYRHYKEKPEKFRVVSADGRVTEYKVKEKHGVEEWKVKEKRDKHEGKHEGKHEAKHGRW